MKEKAKGRISEDGNQIGEDGCGFHANQNSATPDVGNWDSLVSERPTCSGETPSIHGGFSAELIVLFAVCGLPAFSISANVHYVL
jgi:hypothetical protein